MHVLLSYHLTAYYLLTLSLYQLPYCLTDPIVILYCQFMAVKTQYEQCVRKVKHATFTLLVMSSTDGMDRAATTFYKKLASMVSDKRDVPYGKTVNWICCSLSFALVRVFTASGKIWRGL